MLGFYMCNATYKLSHLASFSHTYQQRMILVMRGSTKTSPLDITAHAGMCLELENAREAVASALSQHAAAAADADVARAAAGREISAVTARAEELAAHLETACSENGALSAKLKEIASDNASLQVQSAISSLVGILTVSLIRSSVLAVHRAHINIGRRLVKSRALRRVFLSVSK